MIEFPVNDVFFRNLKTPESWGHQDFDIARKLIKDYRIAIDVGAHVGLTTLRYSKHFEKVFSFEPLLFQYLKTNTKECDNVEIFDCALSDKNTKIKMYKNLWNSGGGIIPTEHNKDIIKKRYTKEIHPRVGVQENDLTEVDCKKLDSFNIQHVDFIKIDVERYNFWVLRGAIGTLTNNSPVIQVERSLDYLDDWVIGFLSELNYHLKIKTSTEFFFTK